MDSERFLIKEPEKYTGINYELELEIDEKIEKLNDLLEQSTNEAERSKLRLGIIKLIRDKSILRKLAKEDESLLYDKEEAKAALAEYRTKEEIDKLKDEIAKAKQEKPSTQEVLELEKELADKILKFVKLSKSKSKLASK